VKLKKSELKVVDSTKRLTLIKADNISLAEKVYAELEEMIVTLQFEPGQMLSESELSEILQVSRTPIGEALQRLAREGLVNILPRRGIVVTEINIADQLKLLEFRSVVSRFAAGSAARQRWVLWTLYREDSGLFIIKAKMMLSLGSCMQTLHWQSQKAIQKLLK